MSATVLVQRTTGVPITRRRRGQHRRPSRTWQMVQSGLRRLEAVLTWSPVDDTILV